MDRERYRSRSRVDYEWVKRPTGSSRQALLDDSYRDALSSISQEHPGLP